MKNAAMQQVPNPFIAVISVLFILSLTGCEKEVSATPVNHPIAQQAQKMGAKRCAPQIDGVSQFLLNGSQFGANLNVDDDAPGRRPLFAATGSLRPDAPPTISLITGIPNADGCSSAYAMVRHWEQSCEQIVGSVYKAYAFQRKLVGDIGMRSVNENLHVFVVPTKSGCLTVQQEITR